MILAVVTFGLGIFFGLRYSLGILVPVLMCVITVHVLLAASGEEKVASTISAVICIACLQGGYMIGLTGREGLRDLVVRLSGSFRST